MKLERYPADPMGMMSRMERRWFYNSTVVNAKGFRLTRALRQISGPVVEVNGPTGRGYEIIEDRLPSAPVISNIKPWDSKAVEAPHMLADAARLPFATHSIGMVLVSGLYVARPAAKDVPLSEPSPMDRAREEYAMYPELPSGQSERSNLRIESIEEAARVLQPNGLLVWASGTVEDVDIAKANDFELCRYRSHVASYGAGATGVSVDAVFRHP